MPVPYSIFWSDEALKNVDSVVAYLESRWSQGEVDAFLEIVEEQEIILSYYPKAYPLSEKSGYRRCVLTKHTTIFYKFEEEAVIIMSVFDTRQNPDKLNTEN